MRGIGFIHIFYHPLFNPQRFENSLSCHLFEAFEFSDAPEHCNSTVLKERIEIHQKVHPPPLQVADAGRAAGIQDFEWAGRFLIGEFF